jgi:ATP synthase I chain
MESEKVLKQLAICVVALGIVALGIGLFFADNILNWIIGIIIGTALSVLKVIMLKKTLDKAVDMSPEDAKNFTRSRYTLRMVLSIAVVVAAFKIPYVNVVSVIVGLLLVQPAVYIVNFINRNKN